jgi:uncharacterized protein YuzE
MGEIKKWYDKEVDILGINLGKDDYWKSIELPNGVVIDITEDGKVIGVEIWEASKYFSGDAYKVLEEAEKESKKKE